ncbi:MAG: discoidin domain-containing protein [Acidobacteriota bacterium]
MAVVAVALLCGALVFTWPLAAAPGWMLPAPGDALYNSWVLAWVADRAAHGMAGVWDSPVFYPYRTTLAFSDPMLAIGLPFAPAYWVSRNPLVLHNVAVWSSFVIAGTGGYALGRDLTGRRSAGIVCGALAAFVPYRLSHLSHVQILMAGWLWWAVWSVHRYFEAPSLAASLRIALFYLLFALSSFYWAYIGLVPLIAVAGAAAWRQRGPARVWFGHGLAAAAMVAVVMVPVIRSARTLIAPTSAVGGAGGAPSDAADVLSYVSGHPGLWLWGRLLRHGGGETDLFPGLIALTCALAAMAVFRRSSDHVARYWVKVYGALLFLGAAASLGAAPTYNGRVLFRNPVFTWLVSSVPGFAQLRAPARFVVIAQLALSVLAAYGVSAWFTRRSLAPGACAIAAAIVAALVFVEGIGAPIPVLTFTPYQLSGDRALYHWLAQQPAGAVLELPMDGWGVAHYSMVYQYRALIHGDRLVNGVARFAPALPDVLAQGESPAVAADRIPEAVAFLRNLAVRYVVIHPTWYAAASLGGEIRAALSRAAAADPIDFGASSVIDLGAARTPPRLPPVKEVPVQSLQVSATTGEPARMLDGDPLTRWINGRPQSGGDRIEIALARSQDLSGVRLQLLSNSLNDYPRRLEVSVSEDGERFAACFSGSVFPALGTALRLSPLTPVIELRWPPIHGVRVRLRQTGASRWFWSIHELRLLTPD